MWFNKLKEQYDKEYNKFCEYNQEMYELDAYIVFLDGKVINTDLYNFVITEDKIFINGEEISPKTIDHITYIIEEIPQLDVKDIEN